MEIGEQRVLLTGQIWIGLVQEKFVEVIEPGAHTVLYVLISVQAWISSYVV